MTFDFFLAHYDFTEYTVKKAFVKGNKLYIDCVMPIYLELIANGYRPEMNMTQEKTFVFSVSHPDKSFKAPYEITAGSNAVTVNQDVLPIDDEIVDIQ